MGNKTLFLVSSLSWQLLRPSSLLVIALVIGLVFAWAGRRPLGLQIITAVTVGFVTLAFLPIGQWAMGTLESRYPAERHFPEQVDGIIVLGGAVVPSLSEIWHMPALTDGAERMTAFVYLARRYPEARLVFAGGGGERGVGRLREADVARQLFDQLGLPQDRVTFEQESLNTAENAAFSRKLIEPKAGETWLMVTSAFHMPRAQAAFAKAGWPVTPYPVGFKSRREWFSSIGINIAQQLELLDYAVHEWLGLLAYKLSGRI